MWKAMAKQAKPSQTETGANVLAPVLHITLHFISAALLGSFALGSICKKQEVGLVLEGLRVLIFEHAHLNVFVCLALVVVSGSCG